MRSRTGLASPVDGTGASHLRVLAWPNSCQEFESTVRAAKCQRGRRLQPHGPKPPLFSAVAKRFSTNKRVDHFRAGIHEIGAVPCRDREVMDGRGRRNETISLAGMALPVVLRRASSAARFLPRERTRIPNRSSPRMTESTAISGSFAQYVGIDQLFHSVSVDSESTGTKKPFVHTRAASRLRPGWAEPQARRGDSPGGRDARHRTPAPVWNDPSHM
jgi:hypothetical protein